MKGVSTIWFPLAILALLAALSLWVDRVVQPPQVQPDGSSRHDPDYIVNNFNTLKTNSQGDPRYQLAAIEMMHFPDDDSTQLKRPRFTQYSTRKPFTQIQAQRGLVSPNGENVYFMDNVKVIRGATRQKGEMTVLTEYLHIIPDQDLVQTDRPVSILQAPRSTARANAMEYNKKLGILKLDGNVKVHYEKPGSNAAPLKTVPALKPAPASGSKEAGSKASKKKTAKTRQTKKKTAGKSGTPSNKNDRTPTGKTTNRIRRTYDQAATPP
ncbi:MAG: LPS export ABC transporter periplasmic protein LptC [Methylobacterium sp.]|nr:LPS export ABC transporter periplasmic protein LptC [Methylobacterium sp.]